MNDLDEHYRRMSALDPSAPGAATRRAVLAHAATVAAAPRTRRRRRALWGSLAAAGLAGFLVVPSWLTTRQPPQHRAVAPAPAAAPEARLRNAERAAAAADGAARDSSAVAVDSEAPVTRYAQARHAAPVAAARNVPGTGLGDAAERGDLAALRALLDGRGEVDARDPAGRSALLRASLQGHAAAVALLLSRGADPNLADLDGLTPLRAAQSAGHGAVVDALRRAGAR